MSEKESQSYQKLLQNVEVILSEISSPNLDLDEMVIKVEKGYALIQKMRERLDEIKGKIEKLHTTHSEPTVQS